MKFTYNSLFHSVHCSSMFRGVKIFSVHPPPLRNPDCSFRKRSSTAWVMRCKMTLQKILLGTDKRVIPRQLLQSLRDPFFGILIITPLLQSVGISSCSQIFVNKGVRMVAASSGSALNSSAFRLSWPGAFPFFRELMAWMISLLVGTSVLMSRSVAASWMFGTTVGGGLFKSSLKCSFQRRCCSPSDVNKIPFLSFTSTLVIWHLPVMILVILYTVPRSLRAASSSA